MNDEIIYLHTFMYTCWRVLVSEKRAASCLFWVGVTNLLGLVGAGGLRDRRPNQGLGLALESWVPACLVCSVD